MMCAAGMASSAVTSDRAAEEDHGGGHGEPVGAQLSRPAHRHHDGHRDRGVRDGDDDVAEQGELLGLVSFFGGTARALSPPSTVMG
jgi:hypothetical protein